MIDTQTQQEFANLALALETGNELWAKQQVAQMIIRHGGNVDLYCALTPATSVLYFLSLILRN